MSLKLRSRETKSPPCLPPPPIPPRLDAYSQHVKYINDYILYYGGKEKYLSSLPPPPPSKTDYDILREEYQFVMDEEEEGGRGEEGYEKRLAKKYYDKLFKEYCVADMSRYKKGQVGLRWRVKGEVFSGKGQFVCGNLACEEQRELKSFEVNFGYLEGGEKKNALVKIRLCLECGVKLNWKKKEKERKKEEAKEGKKEKRKREREEESEYETKKKKKREKEDGEKSKEGERKRGREKDREKDREKEERKTEKDRDRER